MRIERVERRLAAVLAADVVGYSRLIGLDEAGTRRRFNQAMDQVITPALNTHAGRLVKTLGDGVLAEFFSVVDAVTCAMEIQEKMPALAATAPDGQDLIFRIGINLGDLIIEGDDIHGDGVNVAARLEALAEPGGICVSRAARDQIRDKLDIGLTDLGEVEVKNIARPVRAFAVGEAVAARATKVKPVSRTPLMIVVALVSLIVVGVAIWTAWDTGARASVDDMAFALPDRPSLAVLPFIARGGDEGATLLAEAVAEEVTAKLAQVSGLFVISSASTFVYRDRKASAKMVAEELGVRNIVTGVVRPTADGLGVSVEITDAISGRLVFSGEFTGADTALFELEEDISDAIARELAANISRTATATHATKSAEAYLLWYRGSRYYSIAPTPGNMAEARSLAQQSLAIDPDFERAKALFAYARSQEGYFNFVEDRDAAMQEGYVLAQEAVGDRGDWYVLEVLGFATMNLRRYEEALAVFDEAIALAPAQPSILERSALPLLFLGRPEEAIRRLRTAKRLNPFHSWGVPQFMGMGLYSIGAYEEALENLVRSDELNPNFIGNLLWRAATLAQLGRDEEAAAVVAQILAIAPKASISGGFIQIKNAEIQACFEEGLRRAGLSE